MMGLAARSSDETLLEKSLKLLNHDIDDSAITFTVILSTIRVAETSAHKLAPIVNLQKSCDQLHASGPDQFYSEITCLCA